MSGPVDRARLEELPRAELVREAHTWGVRKPEVMTRVELIDEVLRLSTPSVEERRKVRGWLGVARDLIASAVERGLHLPDAAAMIRGDVRFEPLRPPDAPVATVTLAEIYGAQGHLPRALEMLDAVLEKEPEHEAARRLRARIEADHAARRVRAVAPAPSPEPEPVAASEPEPVAAPPRVATPAPEPRGEDAALLRRTGETRAQIQYRAAQDPGEGERLVLRVVELRLRATGAERIESRLPLSTSQGTVTVEVLEAGSVVRAALLIERQSGVVVLAVAGEISPEAPGSVHFAPRRGVDYRALLAPGAERPATP